jgi:hypothetical protein
MYYFGLETVLDNEHGTTLTIGNDTEEKLLDQFFSTLDAGGIPDGTPFKSLTLSVRVPNNAGNWGKPRDRQLNTRQRQKRSDRLGRTLNNRRARRNPIDLEDEEEDEVNDEGQQQQSEEEEQERGSARRPPSPRRRSRVRFRQEEEEEEEAQDYEDDSAPPFENYDNPRKEYSRRYGYRSRDNKTDRMKPAPKKRIRSVSGADDNVRVPPAPRRTQDDDIMKEDDNDHVDAVLRGKAPPLPARSTTTTPSGPPPRNEENIRAMENEVHGIQKLVGRFQDKQALPEATIACGQVLLETIEQHLARYYSHGEYKGKSYNALQSIIKDTQYEMNKIQAPPAPQQQVPSAGTGLPEIGGID